MFCSILFPLERNLMTIRVLSVITKTFPLTKTYIGNYVGIWGAFSQGYMYMYIVLILISVQYFCWKLCCLYNFVLFCEAWDLVLFIQHLIHVADLVFPAKVMLSYFCWDTGKIIDLGCSVIQLNCKALWKLYLFYLIIVS